MKNATPYKRTDRMGDLIRKIVSEVLLSEVHHRGIEGITITGVDISPDLKHAKVYYRVLDLNALPQVKKSLGTVIPKVKRKLASELHTKYSPKLMFIYDESLDHSNKMEEIFKRIRQNAEDE